MSIISSVSSPNKSSGHNDQMQLDRDSLWELLTQMESMSDEIESLRQERDRLLLNQQNETSNAKRQASTSAAISTVNQPLHAESSNDAENTKIDDNQEEDYLSVSPPTSQLDAHLKHTKYDQMRTMQRLASHIKRDIHSIREEFLNVMHMMGIHNVQMSENIRQIVTEYVLRQERRVRFSDVSSTSLYVDTQSPMNLSPAVKSPTKTSTGSIPHTPTTEAVHNLESQWQQLWQSREAEWAQAWQDREANWQRREAKWHNMQQHWQTIHRQWQTRSDEWALERQQLIEKLGKARKRQTDLQQGSADARNRLTVALLSPSHVSPLSPKRHLKMKPASVRESLLNLAQLDEVARQGTTKQLSAICGFLTEVLSNDSAPILSSLEDKIVEIYSEQSASASDLLRSSICTEQQSCNKLCDGWIHASRAVEQATINTKQEYLQYHLQHSNGNSTGEQRNDPYAHRQIDPHFLASATGSTQSISTIESTVSQSFSNSHSNHNNLRTTKIKSTAPAESELTPALQTPTPHPAKQIVHSHEASNKYRSHSAASCSRKPPASSSHTGDAVTDADDSNGLSRALPRLGGIEVEPN